MRKFRNGAIALVAATSLAFGGVSVANAQSTATERAALSYSLGSSPYGYGYYGYWYVLGPLLSLGMLYVVYQFLVNNGAIDPNMKIDPNVAIRAIF